MRKSKKFMALLLTACMGLALLTGCGSKPAEEEKSSAPAVEESKAEESSVEEEATEEIDISEFVTLTMYCIGSNGGIYAEDHVNKLNEVLKEKINAEIDPVMVSWGEYQQKMPMVWASGEAYDLTYSANWIKYFPNAVMGAYMDITELFPKYAPLTYAELVENGGLAATMVDGKAYMIPNVTNDWTTFVYNYREDLRKKYNCPEIVDYETFEIYLQAIKDNEPEMFAAGPKGNVDLMGAILQNEQDWSRPVDTSGVFSYDLLDPEAKVFMAPATPENKAFYERQRDWYNKGFWSQSVLAETTAQKDAFLAGQTAIYLGNVSNSNGAYSTMTTDNPDWEIGIFSSDVLSGTTELIAPANNGTCIGAYAENPERALMFVELCHQDEEVANLVLHGLEGVTFEYDKETRTKWVPEGANPGDLELKNLGMGFQDAKWELKSLNDSPLVNEMKEEYAKYSVVPTLAGFSLDENPISAQIAALKAVMDEYSGPMSAGAIDPAENYDKMIDMLNDAGAEEVRVEIQKQIDEYLATLK